MIAESGTVGHGVTCIFGVFGPLGQVENFTCRTLPLPEGGSRLIRQNGKDVARRTSPAIAASERTPNVFRLMPPPPPPKKDTTFDLFLHPHIPVIATRIPLDYRLESP